MALSTARIHSVRGRPPLLAAGMRSLIHSHSSLVRSLGYIFSFIHLFYTTNEGFSDSLLGGCALQAHTVQPSAMAALIKRSQQSGTESCVRYGNVPNEA